MSGRDYQVALKGEEETTPIRFGDESSEDEDGDEDYFIDAGSMAFEQLSEKDEMRKAEALSQRLLAFEDDTEEEDRFLRRSLALMDEGPPLQPVSSMGGGRSPSMRKSYGRFPMEQEEVPKVVSRRVGLMASMAFAGLVVLAAAFYIGVKFIGPPNQPVGPYILIEKQEGADFFNYYTFYEGRDSAGSNGYNMYIGMDKATELGIVNVTMEGDSMDVFGRRRRLDDNNMTVEKEPFIHMGTSPTKEGPRDSIRLEGIRRFNRGLFIIDVRHMPGGCGVWPAFWLTDEANWPVNGEIDIVEGVNYQSVAKTALHSTKGCVMDDIPLGTMTGGWDTAQGIPDAKTGKPDLTLRYARDCFVYNPHQWLNQGCVAMSKHNGTLGLELNKKGGGVYALEWDPIYRHIRTWVFTPHTNVPQNLVDSIRTASKPDNERVIPDPDTWPLPYGFFAIGQGTNCPERHFRHMRLVFNTAFCGSVAGNRFQMDCPKLAKKFDTCNEYIKSQPQEMKEAYWKIRGVYVYERQWERTWLA